MTGFSQCSSEALDDRVLPRHRPIGAPGEGPDAERIGVAAQHPGGIDDVLDRRAIHHRARLGLQRPAALARLQHDGVPAVEEHRGLEAGAGPEARVHEHHRQDLLLQPAADLAPLDPGGQGQQPIDLRRGSNLPARESRVCSLRARP